MLAVGLLGVLALGPPTLLGPGAAAHDTPPRGAELVRTVVVETVAAGTAAVGTAVAGTVTSSGPIAGTTTHPARREPEPWLPPVDDPVLLRRFAAPATRWGAGHRGVDLASAVGAPVRSPTAGTVTFAGRVVDRDVVTVAHPDGLRSSLEPVEPGVAVGDAVGAGQVVGHRSTGGHCAERCLHWGVRRGETYVDPLTFLGGAPVVLLPLDP